MTEVTRVYLIPQWCGGRAGYRYSATLGGRTIIKDSVDPETDLARALLDLGITGLADVYDGKTGKPRTTIDIERAAKLVTTEGRATVHFEKARQTIDSACPSPEDELAVPTMPSGAEEAA
jgi:hypothetical protein